MHSVSSREPKVTYIRQHEKSDSLLDTIIQTGNYIIMVGTVYTISYYAVNFIKNMMKEKYAVSRDIAKKLDRPELETLVLNEYEARIGKDSVIAVNDLKTTFNDIGGMKTEIEDVMDNIVLPMQIWKSLRSRSDIIPCPTGVLLYGRPGTGKTLTARALAKECGATFLQISSSTLLDKWLGESDKLVSGLFNLARKLAPTIIFIDEIDSILRARGNHDHQPAMATIQSVLLAEWDGLSSGQSSGPVVVVGATNRPDDIDAAFLRRLPVFIKTKTPSFEDRIDILRKMLSKENLASDIDYSCIAEHTEGFTGSELRELVRVASVQRIKTMIKKVKNSISPSSDKNGYVESALSYNKLSMDNVTSCDTPLSMEDFIFALEKTEKSENVAREYGLTTQAEDFNKKLDSFKEIVKSM